MQTLQKVRQVLVAALEAVLLVFTLVALPVAAQAQMYSENIHVLTVHSQNERFYLRSIPYDNEEPSMRGVTRVYARGQSEPLYEFERGFDLASTKSNDLILSDDGETIFYAISWGADEEREGMKSISIYRHGRILRSYTGLEINPCSKRDHCSLKYSNYARIVDVQKSGTWPNYKRVFKDGIPEEELFLADFAIFSNGDTVYLTDSRKRTHVFDLKAGMLTGSSAFDDLYGTMKGLARFPIVEMESYKARMDGFPHPRGGGDAGKNLAAHLGLTEFDYEKDGRSQYKIYEVTVQAYLLRDGSLELEDLKVDEGLPRDKVVEFFKSARFEVGTLPAIFEKYYLGSIAGGETFHFRKNDKRLAHREWEAQHHAQLLEHNASAVVEGNRLIHLDEKGRIRVWRLQDGGFDTAATATFARDDLTHLAAGGGQLWALGISDVYRWSSQDGGWLKVARFDRKLHSVNGFAVVGEAPLLVLDNGVVNPLTGRKYSNTDATGLSHAVAVLGTGSKLWIGTSLGEWGGNLYRLDPRTAKWDLDSGCDGYVTGITNAGTDQVVVSWSMSHMGTAHTEICTHRPGAKPSKYPVLESQYYQTVAFNPFDNKLYGVEQSDVVTISEGRPTPIAELDGRVFGREPMAVGVAPGIGSLVPFAAGALVVVPKSGMPWLLRDGKLVRLTLPE